MIKHTTLDEVDFFLVESLHPSDVKKNKTNRNFLTKGNPFFFSFDELIITFLQIFTFFFLFFLLHPFNLRTVLEAKRSQLAYVNR